ncbi:MAG: choice-of-anchor Q domain-containing protein [bacterium]|nr:choice-of-anchor Q domain-containing protein [bacterium]
MPAFKKELFLRGAIFLCALFFCFGLAPEVRADVPCTLTCYVSLTGNDANPGTIGLPKRTVQAAVNQVNSGGSIVISVGEYVENVEVPFGKNILIDGAGSGTDPLVDTIIDGNDAGNVLAFSGSEAIVRDLTLRDGANMMGATGAGIFSEFGDLTVQNALITSNNGSGIYSNLGNDLTITNTVITGNSGFTGAGIRQEVSGVLLVTDSTISGNAAASLGGGIFLTRADSAIIRGTTISGNTANNGAGVYNSNTDPVTIVNSTISGNTATTNGGGINNNNDGDTDCSNCTSNTIVINSTIYNNTAASGAGVFNESVIGVDPFPDNPAVLTITNTLIGDSSSQNCVSTGDNDTLTSNGHNLSDDTSCATFFTATGDINNEAALVGPLANNAGPTQTHALLNDSPALGAGDQTVCAGMIVGNEDQRSQARPQPAATNCDIGAFESPIEPMMVEQCTAVCYVSLTGNDANGGTSFGDAKRTIQAAVDQVDDGGDVIVDDGTYVETVDIPKNVTITGQGAGVTIVDGDAAGTVFEIVDSLLDVTLAEMTITNGLGDTGGGVYSASSDVTIENAEITENESNTSGGGVFNELGGLILIIDSEITENSATGTGGGGGVYNLIGRTELRNSTVADNESNGPGGGIRNFEGTVVLIGSTVDSNSSPQRGGGIENFGGTLDILEGSVISNNTTEESGGGIYNRGLIASEADLEISESEITGNEADVEGGGLFNDDELNRALVVIDDSLFADNVSDGSGGGIYNTGGLTITESAFNDNNGLGSGGGIHNVGDLTVTGTRFDGNSAGLFTGAGVYNGTLSTATIRDSYFENHMGFTTIMNFGGRMVINGSTLTTQSGTASAALRAGGGSNTEIVNSTFSGNSGSGIDIGTGGTTRVTLDYVTIAENGRFGIDPGPGQIIIRNTLLVANEGGNCDVGTITSNGGNISDDALCNAVLTGANDQNAVDPLLGPLTDFALSATVTIATHPSSAGSPAINNALDSGVNVDQRDVARPQGGGFDSGAYEFEILPGTITIRKETLPNGSLTDFEFDPSYATNFFLTDGTQDVEMNLAPGDYTVEEVVPIGWRLRDVMCIGGTGARVPGTDRAEITLAAGENIVCTFTNEKLSNIIIEKNADEDLDQPFQFTFDDEGSIQNFVLTDPDDGDGGDGLFDNIPTGSYVISEVNIPAGWSLASITCESTIDESSITITPPLVSIDLRIGEDVTCTFNNEQAVVEPGSITVVKQANPAAGAPDFEFDPSYGPNFFLLHGASQPSGDLTPGVYTVEEIVPIGWRVASIVCNDGDSGRVGTTSVAQIIVGSGEDVTCTFNNERLSNIVITKQAETDLAQPFDFTFNDGGGLFNFALSDPDDGDGGDGLFDNIPTGSYTVSEINIPAGWSLDSIVCDSAAAVVNLPGASVTINLGIGQTVNCTFTNVETPTAGTLRVNKIVEWGASTPDAAQTFEFCVSGPSYPTGTEPGACQMVDFDGGTLSWNGLDAGDYVITETDPGAAWTVNPASRTANAALPSGGLVEVDFINTFIGGPTCEGLDPETTLTGVLAFEGNTAIGTITNNSGLECPFVVGLASYKMFDTVIDNQQLFDSEPLTVGAVDSPATVIPAGGSVQFTVELPNCATQVDLFYGPLLPSLMGVRYGTRLLAAIQLTEGRPFCTTSDIDGDGIPDDHDPDIDGDGLPNEADAAPTVFNDLDGDGLGDGLDADMDGDGLPNEVEVAYGLTNPAVADAVDFDGDGTSNADEMAGGLNPYDPNSRP